MLPSDLKPEQFNGYPPEARKLVTDYVGALQRLPLSFVPSLLREVIDYDFRFPPERKAIEKELANLKSLSGDHSATPFRQIRAPPLSTLRDAASSSLRTRSPACASSRIAVAQPRKISPLAR